jgi:phage tail-like protein
MAVQRVLPYSQAHFLVDLGTGQTEGPDAAFSEIAPFAMEVELIRYRAGNSRENSVSVLAGLEKPVMVTLRRGHCGSLGLYKWYDGVRNGLAGTLRTVVISVLSEDATETALTWKLLRARPYRLVWGPLLGQGNGLLIEELGLVCERVEME